jgi:hypothetical protein
LTRPSLPIIKTHFSKRRVYQNPLSLQRCVIFVFDLYAQRLSFLVSTHTQLKRRSLDAHRDYDVFLTSEHNATHFEGCVMRVVAVCCVCVALFFALHLWRVLKAVAHSLDNPRQRIQ